MLFNIVIIVAATVFIYIFSEILSKGTDAIGIRYRINPSVRGATLDAVASSFPEFCTVIFALQAGSFDAGVGTIAGSALYNILVIPAVCVFIGGALKIQKEVVRRDGFLYLAVVCALVVGIWLGPEKEATDGKVLHMLPLWVGLAAIIIYCGYVTLLVMQAKKPTDDDKTEQKSEPEGEKDDKFQPLLVAGKVVVGMGGIGLATHFLVNSSLELFRHWGFSEAITGVTLLAAATSLPDTLLSVFAVKRGDSDGAVSNAFGSNSFDILICLGLPIAFMGGLGVDWINGWPILIFLLGSTIISVVFLLTDLTLSRREGFIMAGIYVVFMVLAFAGLL